jgi:L,D-transpeptidase catalytic domain
MASTSLFANNDEQALSKTDKYIHFVYDKLSFKKMQKLNYETFSKAFYGYLNLKEAGKVSGNQLLTICDFSLSSNLKRCWVIDVAKKKVLFNTLVAHGMGSGEEYATKFSNIHESHQSSLGFYSTGETYMGDNGYSLKLNGLDGIFNNNAFDRAIVIHGADYVSTTFASANNRLGRSHGCPALPREVAEAIINKIQNGSIVFVYHPTKAYIKNSYWLNNSISHLPEEADYLDLLQPKNTNPRWVAMAASRDSVSAKNTQLVKKLDSAAAINAAKNTQIQNAKPGLPSAATPANANADKLQKPKEPVKDERDFLYIR